MAASNKNRSIIISPQAKEDILKIIVYLKSIWGQNVVDEFFRNLQIFIGLFLSIHGYLVITIKD